MVMELGFCYKLILSRVNYFYQFSFIPFVFFLNDETMKECDEENELYLSFLLNFLMGANVLQRTPPLS